MAESVISSVAQYLGGLLVQEADFLGGVTDQIVKIQVEMNRMQCFLKDADARQDESALVRNWVLEIKELAYDVEDAIDTYILKAKYANFFNPKKYIRLHQIGKEIKTLQSKIHDITHSIETYDFIRTGQGEGTCSTTEMRQQLRQSYPHYDDEDVVGIEYNKKLLVAELINKEGPHLVSITGMGGLGKTTLAKKVYNHDVVKKHFDCRAWSFISQQFQARTVLQGIIEEVYNSNEGMGIEKMDETWLKKKLYKLLEDKCYLVVLDDIWSIEAWDVLKSVFPKGKMGSKIMLTTRIKDVALYADPTGFLHEPMCLTEEQSWELLCKKAFHWKNVASTSSSLYPPEAEKKEKLGRDMIKKCGGLPLAVVMLGGLLATKTSIHEWEMVAKDIGRYLNKAQKQQEHHGVSWILSLSYHDLPSYLKSCFLYLGLYLEDTQIHKRELIQMWIAEGFVQHNGRGTTMEEIGEEYLVELINRSIVQVDVKMTTFYIGERHKRVRTYHLHDLMRDLCLRKAKEENFLDIFYGESPTGDSSSSTSVVASISDHRLRRHAIHFTCDRYVSMQQPTTSSPHLRAFFALWKPDLYFESSVTLKFVCKKFKFLRVLVLENVEIDSLPKAIGKLIHLRYLRLIGKPYFKVKVPPSIGKLQSLQFLTLENIERLPNVLWKMEQLIYCHCLTTTTLPLGGGGGVRTHDNKALRVDGHGLKNKNLSTLKLQWGKELMLEFALPKLTNLRILHLYDIDGIGCKSLHQFSISRLDRLQCLRLDFWIVSDDFDWSPLSCCQSLWKLHLSGRGLTELPKLEEFPPNLTKLKLEAGILLEDPIPTLEMLPYLENLFLYSADPNASQKYYISAKGFQRLQYLRI